MDSNNKSNNDQVFQRTGSQGSSHGSGRSRRSSISGSRKASLVITPETVPQFVIPSLGNPSSRRASATTQASPEIICPQDIRRHHSFTEALLRHDNTSIWPAIGPILIAAQHSRKDSTDDDSENNELQVPFTKERSSSDASSRYLMPPTWDNIGDCRKATSDPGFNLSMTLSHLTTVVTPYGFPVLSQAPSTNRKESLLLSSPRSSKNASAASSTPAAKQENGHSQSHSQSHSHHTPDNNNNSNNSSMCNKIMSETRRRFVRQLTNDSSVSSSVSTCSAASEVWEDSDDITSPITAGGRSISEISSSTDSDTACEPQSTASSPENSPTASPARRGQFRRCHTITGTTPPAFRRKRLSDAGKDGRAQTLQHLHLHCARQGQSKDLGDIHLSFNYDRTFKLLKVIMLRAENIGRSEGAPSEEVSSFAKIYLMPGKRQPQQTRLVRGTCDPEYNEIFYYKNVSLTDLRNCQLRVKINRSKRSGMGEAWIPLASLEHQPVMLVREELRPKLRSEVSYTEDFINLVAAEHFIRDRLIQKVESAFWSFCRRCRFVFKFLLFFIVLGVLFLL